MFAKGVVPFVLFAGLAVAAPAGVVSQISDGQPQAPTGVVSQISDGQPQAPTGVVTQISDGQPQAPTGTPVTQISDGQPQAPAGVVTQISDGQPQAPTGVVSQISDGQPQAPAGVVTQISDGQPQAPTGVVSQISDGQPQAPAGVVTQISDGQPQAPTGTPVTQISDGQPQAPAGVVTQISDGQPQAPTGTPVTQISDGQPQAPTGVVSQISDGQPQAPASTLASTYVASSSVVAAVDEHGNLPGYTNAAAPYGSYKPQPLTAVASVFGPDSQIAAIPTQTPNPTASAAGDTLRSLLPTGPTSHGPYSGTPTTLGAVSNAPLAASVGTLPPNPTATYYNTNGRLQNEEPAPYTPAGGLGTNGSLPRYMVNSDFDYESITLGLYQEWIELDTFNNGLAIFSDEDFIAAGLTAEDRSLIAFMGQQEQGHATLLSNMLGETAPPQCTYNYPYSNVREFLDFNQILTRFGESGVWGFINHLDSREVGQLLAQSIATEARQEMIFRQLSGLHPMPVWFESGIPQSWAWTYLAPYISNCPENTTRVAWQNFPALLVKNQANINRFSPNDTQPWERTDNRTASPATIPPQDESCINVNVTGYGCGPAISHNRSEPLSFAGKRVDLVWDNPGQAVGPNNSYITATNALGPPKFVAWAAQLNLTYTPLTVTGPNEGYTYQPAAEVYETKEIVNGTMFIALIDEDLYLTPFNLTMINPHVVALGIYQAG